MQEVETTGADEGLEPGARIRVEPYGLEHRSRFKYLVLPVLFSLGLWGLCWLFEGKSVAIQVITAVGASLTFVGPAIILGPAVIGPGALPQITLSSWQLAWIIAYNSVLMAFVYAYNLDLFERIPKIGDFFRRVRLGAAETLKGHKWIRRLATVGIVVFVILPLPGSGSLGGSIIGRLIGLGPRRTFIATAAAGVLVAFGYGYFGETLKAWLDANQIGTGLRVAGLLASLLILWFAVKLLKSLAAKAPPEALARVPVPESHHGGRGATARGA